VSGLAIVDSGGANIASLQFALERLQTRSFLTADAVTIRNASRVLLPGVGAAGDAMQRLSDSGLIDVIRALEQPVLGICLGMQLLCDGSEEEDVECLGIIPGIVEKLTATPQNPVPNTGWCATQLTADHPVLDDIADNSFFYYLHSYALPVSGHTLASATHTDEFSAVVAHKNFVAVQFHPERSAASGARLLRNFVAPLA
jgi:imidazole glycerol-phosphate synthase subunit HisH